MSDSDIVVVGAKDQARDPNNLTLFIAGNEYTGWEDIAVTLRAEGFPNSFEVKSSVRPGNTLPAKPGDDCVVLLGDDTVITGYVDRVVDSGDAGNHEISIEGRGKTQDLVDCTAEWPSGQIINGDAQTISENLTLPYSIGVTMVNGASPGPTVSPLLVNYCEHAADIIQRVARNAGLLAYENHKGNLALAAVGTVSAASGIAFGQNVQSWSVEHSMHERFSEYIGTLLSTDPLAEIGGGADPYAKELDPNVRRHRRLHLVPEASADPGPFLKKMTAWEAQRRVGRSFSVRATIDSWRDSAGTLWTPNTLVPVQLPAATDGTALVISEVTFKRNNQDGTTAEITAMPKEAFTPEPISLVSINTNEFVQPPADGAAQ